MGEDVDTARFWSCTRRKMRQAQTYPFGLAVTIQRHEIERVGPEKTCSQALFDNIQSVSDMIGFGKGGQPDFHLTERSKHQG